MFFMFLLFVFPSFDFILSSLMEKSQMLSRNKYVSSKKSLVAEQLLLFDYSLIILFPVAKIICFFQNI